MIFNLFFNHIASDSAAGLPHEDPAQLPPPEENGERKRHACKKLMRIQRTETSCSPKHLHTQTPYTRALHLNSCVLILHFSISLSDSDSPCPSSRIQRKQPRALSLFRSILWLFMIYFGPEISNLSYLFMLMCLIYVYKCSNKMA